MQSSDSITQGGWTQVFDLDNLCTMSIRDSFLKFVTDEENKGKASIS